MDQIALRTVLPATRPHRVHPPVIEDQGEAAFDEMSRRYLRPNSPSTMTS
jgi:hypothetical protein